jgi:hypothetical protein
VTQRHADSSRGTKPGLAAAAASCIRPASRVRSTHWPLGPFAGKGRNSGPWTAPSPGS